MYSTQKKSLTNNDKIIIAKAFSRQFKDEIYKDELNKKLLKKSFKQFGLSSKQILSVFSETKNTPNDYKRPNQDLIKFTKELNKVKKVEDAFHFLKDLGCDTLTSKLSHSNSVKLISYDFNNLFYWIDKANVQQVIEILKRNVNLINETNEFGNTPLAYCCSQLFFVTEGSTLRRKFLEIVDILLGCDPKPDLEIKNIQGQTVIFIAVKLLNEELTDKLIANGANIHAVNVFAQTDTPKNLHRTPLIEMLLCEYEATKPFASDVKAYIENNLNRLKFAKWLISKHNCDINFISSHGLSILGYAARTENSELLDMLYQLNINFNQKMYTFNHLELNVLSIILANAERDKEQNKPWFTNKRYSLIKKIFKYGYDIEQHKSIYKDKYGHFTPMIGYIFVSQKDEKLKAIVEEATSMKFFVGRGKNVSTCLYIPKTNFTPIETAIYQSICDLCITQLEELEIIINDVCSEFDSDPPLNNQSLTAITNHSTSTFFKPINIQSESLLARAKIDEISADIQKVKAIIDKFNLSSHLPSWIDKLANTDLTKLHLNKLDELHTQVNEWSMKSCNRLLNYVDILNSEITANSTSIFINTDENENLLLSEAIYENAIHFSTEQMIPIRKSDNLYAILKFERDNPLNAIYEYEKFNEVEQNKILNMINDLSKLTLNDNIVILNSNHGMQIKVNINGHSSTRPIIAELRIPGSPSRVACYTLKHRGKGPTVLVLGCYIRNGFHDDRHLNHIFQSKPLILQENPSSEMSETYEIEESKMTLRR